MRAWRATESDACRRIEGNQPIRRCQFLIYIEWVAANGQSSHCRLTPKTV